MALIEVKNVTKIFGPHPQAALARHREGLGKEESDALNARLILTLCNHIGDRDVLTRALEVAKSAG